MPTQPPIDGLPLWAQLVISFAIGLATLGAAFSGYFKKRSAPVEPADKATAAIMAASIVDMGAIRNLSDVCIRLSGVMDNLQDAVEESTHYSRNHLELNRETCGRIRELRESVDRLTAVMERGLK